MMAVSFWIFLARGNCLLVGTLKFSHFQWQPDYMLSFTLHLCIAPKDPQGPMFSLRAYFQVFFSSRAAPLRSISLQKEMEGDVVAKADGQCRTVRG